MEIPSSTVSSKKLTSSNTSSGTPGTPTLDALSLNRFLSPSTCPTNPSARKVALYFCVEGKVPAVTRFYQERVLGDYVSTTNSTFAINKDAESGVTTTTTVTSEGHGHRPRQSPLADSLMVRVIEDRNHAGWPLKLLMMGEGLDETLYTGEQPPNEDDGGGKTEEDSSVPSESLSG